MFNNNFHSNLIGKGYFNTTVTNSIASVLSTAVCYVLESENKRMEMQRSIGVLVSKAPLGRMGSSTKLNGLRI